MKSIEEIVKSLTRDVEELQAKVGYKKVKKKAEEVKESEPAEEPNEITVKIEGDVLEVLRKIAKDKKQSIQEALSSVILQEGKALDEKKNINKLSRQFSDMFCEKYIEYRGNKYMFRGAIDKKLCDRLVKTFTLEQLSQAVDKFFTVQKPRRWWTSYTLAAFYTSANDLAGELKGKYDEIERRAYRKYVLGIDDEEEENKE